MKKSDIKKLEKEYSLYKIETSKSRINNHPFEIWRKNKRYGYYNFICYSDSNDENQIKKLILKRR